MPRPLPRLRMNLDFMPSPVPGRPGLLIRDSYGYSGSTLIIPPALVECLECFDGDRTESDLRESLVRITGDLHVSPLIEHLVATLSDAGFLENEIYFERKAGREREFAAAAVRESSHAGAAYPGEPADLREVFAGYLNGPAALGHDSLLGIAAPHVSPCGGWQTYRAAYSALGPAYRDRTFVILGTSHYGEPDAFGLTRKNFVTPYGEARTDLDLVAELAAEPAVTMEDYCHAIEHSIEFQVVFLQHLFGPEVRVLPILCGSFARSIYQGGLPEDNEDVRRFLGHLGEIAAREGPRLLWLLGIDLAHIGRRYGDGYAARADDGRMIEVAGRDRERIDRVNAADARAYWELVQENNDDLRWCGSAPLYTFLKTVPGAQGELRRYEQWNIDEQSVVSFAALTFTK
ncbi:MAG: AmmeMemoRadiSam system protein B [Acidobacteria bacterium]|nr:AmmeMemoRadiSam system protein B [Acidobacteriota bacterium]